MSWLTVGWHARYGRERRPSPRPYRACHPGPLQDREGISSSIHISSASSALAPDRPGGEARRRRLPADVPVIPRRDGLGPGVSVGRVSGRLPPGRFFGSWAGGAVSVSRESPEWLPIP